MRIATARLRRYPQRGTKSGRNLPIKDHGGAKRLAYRVDKYASAGRRQKVLTQGGERASQAASPAREQLSGAPPPPQSYIFPVAALVARGATVKARGIRGMKPRPRRRIPPPRYGEDKEISARRGRLRVTLKRPLVGAACIPSSAQRSSTKRMVARATKARCLFGRSIEMEIVALSA